MEGVLVSAKKEGSTITTTVVSDDKGQFSFPAAKVEPGKYVITIRAAGYTLVGPKTVDVAASSGTTADIKLARGEEPGLAAIQRGVAHQRPRRRPDQVVPARLRGLPLAAARLHGVPRRRRMGPGLHPHGPLRARKARPHARS